jgi:hypothetical protein
MSSSERRDVEWPGEAPRQRRRFPWSSGTPRERRRTRWGDFRGAYPRIVTAMALGLVALGVLDVFLLVKRAEYRRQIQADRVAMTATERQRADGLLAAAESRDALAQALVRQQASTDRKLNLGVSLEKGTMDLQREGAELRAMRVQVGPEVTVGQAPGARKITPPLGLRRVAAVVDESYPWQVPAWVYAQRGQPVPASRRVPGALGRIAVLLDDGTVVYSRPSQGPLADDAFVLPGGIRADAADLEAIRENLTPGLPVYFFP